MESTVLRWIDWILRQPLGIFVAMTRIPEMMFSTMCCEGVLILPIGTALCVGVGVGGGTYVTNMIVVMSVAVVCMWCNLKG